MAIILVQDTGTPHWFEEVLNRGYGVYMRTPKTIVEVDKVVGMFFWHLSKGRPGTFLVFYDDRGVEPEVRKHAQDMLALFPNSTRFLGVDESVEDLQLSGGLVLTNEIPPPAAPLNRKPVSKLRARLGRWKGNLKQWPARVLADLFETMTGKVISIHTRPLYADGYTESPNEFKQLPACAIVVQGPVQLKRSFTLETVRLYKKIFPYADIVVSTWEGEDEATLESIRQSGATVITNKPPQQRGWGNANLQIFSAAAGIKVAAERGAEFILKQRSDQRIYNAVALEMMLAMLVQFPPGEKSNQKKRIIFGNGGPALHPYWMSEILFGATEDIAEYYDPPPVENDKSAYSSLIIEAYLPSEYLKRKGWHLEWTVEQGLEVYKNCFIALDWWTLDLYWYKYQRWGSTHQRSYTYAAPSRSLVNFGEWLSILVDSDNKVPRPEQRLIVGEIRKKGESQA